MTSFPEGFHFLPQYLGEAEQLELVSDVRAILDQAPLFQQKMPKTGTPMSVRMSNAGVHGWVIDRDGGYRYQNTHPVSGLAWPPIPQRLLQVWSHLTGEVNPPNLCLVNYYGADARLGLHQDRGAGSLDAPVVSISLGDDATFALGGLSRRDRVQRFALHSGDLIWFGGSSRLIFHGVEGIHLHTSTLLERGRLFESGRINITLRRISWSA